MRSWSLLSKNARDWSGNTRCQSQNFAVRIRQGSKNGAPPINPKFNSFSPSAWQGSSELPSVHCRPIGRHGKWKTTNASASAAGIQQDLRRIAQVSPGSIRAVEEAAAAGLIVPRKQRAKLSHVKLTPEGERITRELALQQEEAEA